MSNDVPLVYFESSMFIALIKGEPSRRESCVAAMTDAESGVIRAISSAFTIAEVIKPPGSRPLSPEAESKIDAFFQHVWLRIVQVDRRVATEARRVAREGGLKPPDAIHVATATLYKAQFLFTYDEKILELEDRIPGLRVQKPAGQLRFGF